MKNIKQVVEIPASTLEEIKARLDQIEDIHRSLRELGKVETPEFYTPKQFMQRARIGRNKFDEIKPKLNAVQVSPRKLLIPHSDLIRWFKGELSC